MPGLSVVAAKRPVPIDNSALQDCIEPHKRDGYKSTVLIDSRNTSVWSFNYPEYPIRRIDIDDLTTIIEGHIYGSSNEKIENDLHRITDELLHSTNPDLDRISKWLHSTCGDFLVAAYSSKTERFAVFNDLLGRLPVYLAENRDAFLLTREIGTAVRFLDDAHLDKRSIAEYLSLGFCLNHKTIYSGITRVPPATLLIYDAKDCKLEYHQLAQLNLGLTSNPDSTNELADQLVSLFEETCKQQASLSDSVIVSLSGGLDSRSVAAGLSKIGADPNAITFLDKDRHAATDVAIAREVATALGIPWQLVELPSPTGHDAIKVLNQKWGLISMAMAFDIPYMNNMLDIFGRRVFQFSGDGGDKPLPNHYPPFTFRSTRSLAVHILNRNYVFDPETIADLLRIDKSEIIDTIQEAVESYPEESLQYRYVHFVIAERGIQWSYEGEDRNRCMLWSCSPFYGLDFFRTAMYAPAELKRGHDLYRLFLRKLSPGTAGIIHSNRGLPVTGAVYRRKVIQISRMWRYPGLLRWIRGIMRPAPHVDGNSVSPDILKTQIEECRELADYFDISILKQLVKKPSKLTKETLYNILTITSVIERITGSNETLEKYTDRSLE